MPPVDVISPQDKVRFDPTIMNAYYRATSDVVSQAGVTNFIAVFMTDIHKRLKDFYGIDRPTNYPRYLDLIDAKNSPFAQKGWTVEWVPGDTDAQNYFLFSHNLPDPEY